MKLIPDYSSRGAAALADRSVTQWPEKVTVPLLMIHGGDDEEVPVSQALAFAATLSRLRKEYELMRASLRGSGVFCVRGGASLDAALETLPLIELEVLTLCYPCDIFGSAIRRTTP